MNYPVEEFYWKNKQTKQTLGSQLPTDTPLLHSDSWKGKEI